METLLQMTTMPTLVKWVGLLKLPAIRSLRIQGLVATGSMFYVSVCPAEFGPPLPESSAETYLVERGYGSNVVTAVVEYGKMEHGMIVELAQAANVAVRHMVARNRYLTHEERTMFWHDKDFYVRSGVAMNPNLDQEEILSALEDGSTLVLNGLALNPMMPEDVLMALRSKHNVGLEVFAQNPSCPTGVIKEIESTGGSLSKKLLVMTQSKKKEIMNLPGRMKRGGGYYWGQPVAPWLNPKGTIGEDHGAVLGRKSGQPLSSGERRPTSRLDKRQPTNELAR